MTSRMLPPTVPQFESSALVPEPTTVPRRPVEPLSRTTSAPVPVTPYAGPIRETGRDTGWVIAEYLRRTGGQPLPTLPTRSADTPSGHGGSPAPEAVTARKTHDRG